MGEKAHMHFLSEYSLEMKRVISQSEPNLGKPETFWETNVVVPNSI